MDKKDLLFEELNLKNPDNEIKILMKDICENITLIE